MSLTHFRPVSPFYISDFLMFRAIRSLNNAIMGRRGCIFVNKGYGKTRVGVFLFSVAVAQRLPFS